MAIAIANEGVKALVELTKEKGLGTPHTRREKASICEIGLQQAGSLMQWS